jgi:hypothetical protein
LEEAMDLPQDRLLLDLKNKFSACLGVFTK